jgi:hypothetical protein
MKRKAFSSSTSSKYLFDSLPIEVFRYISTFFISSILLTCLDDSEEDCGRIIQSLDDWRKFLNCTRKLSIAKFYCIFYNLNSGSASSYVSDISFRSQIDSLVSSKENQISFTVDGCPVHDWKISNIPSFFRHLNNNSYSGICTFWGSFRREENGAVLIPSQNVTFCEIDTHQQFESIDILVSSVADSNSHAGNIRSYSHRLRSLSLAFLGMIDGNVNFNFEKNKETYNHLTSLSLCIAIPKSDILKLQYFPNLEYLAWDNVRFPVVGFKNCKQLKKLILTNVHLNDKDIQEFIHIPSIRFRKTTYKAESSFYSLLKDVKELTLENTVNPQLDLKQLRNVHRLSLMNYQKVRCSLDTNRFRCLYELTLSNCDFLSSSGSSYSSQPVESLTITGTVKRVKIELCPSYRGIIIQTPLLSLSVRYCKALSEIFVYNHMNSLSLVYDKKLPEPNVTIFEGKIRHLFREGVE